MTRSHSGRRIFLAGSAATAAVFAGLGAASALPGGDDQTVDDQTVDGEMLARALERARGLDQLHSMVVGHRGEVVAAAAFRGPALDTPANIKSASKTVVATLTGIAIDRGLIAGVDAPVAPLLDDLVPAEADPLVQDITVDHLLTMRAGLDRTSGPNYGAWVASANWLRHVLTRPFVDVPGGRMLYSTGSYHLLGAVLARVTGRSLLALARDWLGTPLAIQVPPWTRDPQGFFMGGNNMALAPTALWRLGEMVRAGGIWNGRRVVSEAWIEASWVPRTRSPFSGDDYGYGWFATTLGDLQVRYARGYGGQLLYVVPEAALTVAITSDPNRPARSHGYIADVRALLAEDIIPAVG